jgi:putative intracellular protease/amidase
MSTRIRRLVRLLTAGAVALLLLAGFAVAGLRTTTAQERTAPKADRTATLTASRPTPGGPHTVAVALGASGTITSDALAPYEVFASSPQFSVYTVAASTDPAPTQGGPSIVPAFTFDDVTTGRAPKPDVVVVPAVAHPDGADERALRGWLVEQARAGARILGVCAGARVLSATGLLDGRTATSHWSRVGALAKQRPQVHWVRGQRYVQDGPFTTTAGVTSGIPGALRVMADVAGSQEAQRVGDVVGYPNWSLTGPTDIPVQAMSGRDLPVGLNALIPWGRPTLGIALHDGVGEVDVASAFEVYDVSYAARAVPLSDTGAVTTRHGLVLRTETIDEWPSVGRLAVPGAGGAADLDPGLTAWATEHRTPVDAIHSTARGFDGALEYLAQRSGRRTALSAAKMIDYPTTQLALSDSAGQASGRTSLLLGLALLLSGGAAASVARLW